MTTSRQRTRVRQPASPSVLGGAAILGDIRTFTGSMLYAADEMLDALTLACAATHTIASFTTVPRLLATSEEAESGKTTVLDIITMLGSHAWEGESSQPALRAAFQRPERPVVVIDEISQVFGKGGNRGNGTELAKILLKGYRCTSTFSLQVDGADDEISSFCFAAFGGLKNAVPKDIRSRCIVWNMHPAPENIRLRDTLDEDTLALAEIQRTRLHQWARTHESEIKDAFRNMRAPHRKFRSRRRQIWGALFAVAQVAGGAWPQKCLAAFKMMGLDASDAVVLSAEQRVIRDAAACFERSGAGQMLGADLREQLLELPDAKLYRALSENGFAQLMSAALGSNQAMTVGNRRARGWHAARVLTLWDELEEQLEAVQAPGGDDNPYEGFFDVEYITEVTHVTAHQNGTIAA
jgi:hypothetical protein